MAKHSDIEWLASDGMPMHAVRWQPDSEPIMVVCIIHGLGEHSGRYANMAEYYTSRDIEVVSFDLRGHGKSGGQRGHSDDFQQIIRDIDQFLYKASGIDIGKPHFIYGHSLGGTLTIKYALTHPGQFKGVILSSPLFKPTVEPPKWKLMLGRLVQSSWPTLSLSSSIDPRVLTRDKVLLENRTADPLMHGKISAKLGTQMLYEGQRLLDEALSVNFPLLVMHGDADELTSHQASALFAKRAGPKCTLKIWQGFYHELHHEPEKQEVFDYCINWMKRGL